MICAIINYGSFNVNINYLAVEFSSNDLNKSRKNKIK